MGLAFLLRRIFYIFGDSDPACGMAVAIYSQSRFAWALWVFRGEAEQVEVNSHSHSSGMATRRMSLKVNGSQLADQGGLGIHAQKDHDRIKLDSLFGSQLV